MKKITFLLMLAFVSIGVFANMQSKGDVLELGPKIDGYTNNSYSLKTIEGVLRYDNNEINQGIGNDNPHTIEFYNKFTASDLSNFVGKEITHLKVGMGNPSHYTVMKIRVLLDDITSTPVFEEDHTNFNMAEGMNLIELNSAYEIPSGKDVFLGIYLESSGGFGIAIDTDGSSNSPNSGLTFMNGNFLGSITNIVGADFVMQGIITDDGNVEGNIKDLAIVDANTTTETCVLSSTESIDVTLINIGDESINEIFDLTVEVNESPVTMQVSPTGFTPGSEMTLTLDSWDMSAGGNYSIKAYHNLNDHIVFNNTLNKDISTGDAYITVDLLTDGYSSETSWIITNMNGDTIATNGALANTTQHSTDVCVNSDDCYTWTIFDSYGDGIAPSGTFTISYNGNVVATCVAGGNFGSSFSVSSMGSACPENDFTLSLLDIDSQAPVNTPVDIKGTVINNGTASLTSFDVSYKIGNHTSAIYNVSGIDVATGESYDFTHNAPFTFAEIGTYTIEVTIANPNGAEDHNESDNSLSSDIIIYAGGFPRTVLVEEFSTEECPNCPPVATYLSGIAHDNDNVIMMVHHVGYYTDDYTIPESQDLLPFYGGGGTFAPGGMMDRHYNGLDNDSSGTPEQGPVFWPGPPYGGNKINDRLNQVAFVNVNLTGTFNEDTKEVSVTVSGKFSADFTDDLGVSLWIVEDGIISTTQAGASGEFTHHAVARDAISASLGDAITTSTNTDDTYSTTYTYTVNDAWVADSLTLIGFVNKIDPDDINNRTVLNAAAVKLTEISSSSDVVSEHLKKVSLYPNPFNNELNIEGLENIDKVVISNIIGQSIMTIPAEDANRISTSNLNNGIYMITFIDKDNNSRTERIVKQ